MIELEPGHTLDINLKEDSQGRDRVVLALQSQGCMVNLTPHQARVLATELIMAVNRAEVRSRMPTQERCKLCGSVRWVVLEDRGGARVIRFACGFVFVTPHPPNSILEGAYGEDY